MEESVKRRCRLGLVRQEELAFPAVVALLAEHQMGAGIEADAAHVAGGVLDFGVQVAAMTRQSAAPSGHATAGPCGGTESGYRLK